MKNIFIALFLFSSIAIQAQNQAYYTKQTQVSEDLESFEPLSGNKMFTKIVLRESGIEFYASEKEYSSVDYSEVEKVKSKDDGFTYEVSFPDKMKVIMQFAPYPSTASEPHLLFAIVSMPGLFKTDPKRLTFFRLAFIDEFVIDR